MTLAAGLLTGFADGVEKKRARETRERELGILESAAALRSAPGATDYAAPASGNTFAYDGAISDRPAYAFDFYTNKGVPGHVAAGLVGNLMQESGADINPAAVGDNGNAFGSGQWNGVRKRAYLNFANERGVDPSDFDTQLEFLWHEGQTSERGAWDAIMAATTPEEAALIASQKFWRPGTPHNERRQAYAKAVFDSRIAPKVAAPTKSAPVAGQWFTSFFEGAQ